jgi:hypothetical protein
MSHLVAAVQCGGLDSIAESISRKISMQRRGSRFDGWTNKPNPLLLKAVKLPLTVHRNPPACIFAEFLMTTDERFPHGPYDDFLNYSAGAPTESGQRR